MQLQAPSRSVNSTSLATSPVTRTPARTPFRAQAGAAARGVCALSAIALATVAVAGCGSSMVGGTPAQNVVTPIASAKGPQLGYLWIAADKTLRPILGVSGASQMGQSVVPAGVYIGATASATASIAVLQDTEGAFDLVTLPSGSPVSLGLALPAGASIRLSPAATAALVYTPGAASASLITGLPSTPSVHSIAAPGAIADSAVSDTGSVGFAYAQGSSFAIGVAALDGRSTPIASVKSIGGINFLPGHDDLLFADSAANSLTLVRSSTSAPASAVIPAGQLLNSPSAVGISGSGRWALVSNSGSQTLVRVDLTTLTATSVACSCKPTLASTLADDGAFRVTDAPTGPNWIVDAAPATPRTLFIPALPAPVKTSLVASAVGS
jgi:hypothetical protein